MESRHPLFSFVENSRVEGNYSFSLGGTLGLEYNQFQRSTNAHECEIDSPHMAQQQTCLH